MRETIGDSYIDADFSILDKMLSELDKGHFVDVGILGEKGGKTEGGGITVAMLGAVHEFGSLIKHPGGTPYIIGPDGKATFVKKGTKGAVLMTKPHDIPMPKRSFIAMPLQTKQAEIQKEVEPGFAGHLEKGDIKGIFADIGIAAEGQIQDAFDTGGFGTWKKDSSATVRRKGSASVLIEHSILRKSITSKPGVSG